MPIHKENNRQCLVSYPPLSLLPVCSKILERLIINEMFPFFIKNGLISPNPSCLKPGDFNFNQILSTTRKICKSFNDGFNARSVFLDISKTFNKVWHEGIIFKLRQNDISNELLKRE